MKPIELVETFSKSHGFSTSKGKLCVALVVTRAALERGLPLDPNALLTAGGGQVQGLGKAQVQAILQDHGIHRVLAEEGGRTSRGSIGNMNAYASLLNGAPGLSKEDLTAIEAWWVSQVQAFFASKPLLLRADSGKSTKAMIQDLLDQARTKQQQYVGSTFVGSVLQHLVGAKLSLVVGSEVEHHGASVADGPTGRDADFLIQDSAVHVTAAPGEALIRKVQQNLDSGKRPLIVTLDEKVGLAEGLCENDGIRGRVDVLGVEQFLTGNLYELGGFDWQAEKAAATELVKRYNEIVDQHETDPSLRIELRN